MPTTSKFTERTRQSVLEVLRLGASLRTAAIVAGISPSTLTRWLGKADSTAEGSRWREFKAAVLKAQAEPKIRALTVINREMQDDSRLAWRFLERREEGFEPSMPRVRTGPEGPLKIEVKMSDGTPALPRAVNPVGEIE